MGNADILQYQGHRPLNQCPGFLASIQVADGDGKRYFIGLRRDGLELYCTGDRHFLFDLEGRPLRFSRGKEHWFRGLAHEGISLTKDGTGGALLRRRTPPTVLNAWCEDAWSTGTRARDAIRRAETAAWSYPGFNDAKDQLLPLLDRVTAVTPEELAASQERFHAVYQPVPVLPPDHYQSLVVQATEGCSFNTCTFCSLYRGVRFRVRSLTEFASHLAAVRAFHGEGLRRFTQIFLGQANALAIPQDRLVELLRELGRTFAFPSPNPTTPRPSWGFGYNARFLGIGSFLDGFTGLRKTAEDYRELRSLHLTRVYLGVESGCESLLQWLKKPATSGDMLETISRLKAAGLHTDVIVLAGVGGKRWEVEHVEQTLAFLRQSALVRGDRVYLSPIVEQADSPYPGEMNREGWERLDANVLRFQMETLAAGIRAIGLQAVPYRVDPFIY